MKVKLLFFVVILAVLALSSFACLTAKTTGGGAFYDQSTGDYITFGFNAQPIGEPYVENNVTFHNAKGQFQLVDHTTKTKINGSFTRALQVSESESPEPMTLFWGTCTVNKEGPYGFEAGLFDGSVGPDALDAIVISLDTDGDYIFAEEGELSMVGVLLEGSDIVVHTPK